MTDVKRLFLSRKGAGMIIQLITILYVLMQCDSHTATIQPSQCVHVKNTIFRDCRSTKYSSETYRKKTSQCINEGICKKQFKITFVRSRWFLANVYNQFSEMMEECCGDCWSNSSTTTLRGVTDIDGHILNESDIILPILATKPSNHLYSFHYIPVLDAPSSYYFTLRATKVENAVKLVMACLNTWPLIIIFLLMACISGFIMWLLEKKVNGTEFPLQFHKGLLEGFWWSFVSMTAVGYGDRTPKSCPARMCAIFWILVGITIFSIFTGSLTYHITSIHSYRPDGFHGKIVAGLSDRQYDVTMVAQHGGIFRHVQYEDTVMGIVDLIKRLEKKSIDGFLLSRPTYYFFLESVKNSGKYKVYGKYIKKINEGKIDLREKLFNREPLVLGMLVKDTSSYQYFKKYFEDNWLQIQDNAAFSLNCEAHKLLNLENAHFTGGLIYYFLYGVIGVIVIIGCFGLLKEGHKWFKCLFNVNKNEIVETGKIPEMI